MSRDVDRETFRYCGETCPAVDSAIEDAIKHLEGIVGPDNHKDMADILWSLASDVKRVGTEKLRDALRSCVDDKQDIQRELDESRDECSDLKSRISELEHTVSSLEKELSQCAN